MQTTTTTTGLAYEGVTSRLQRVDLFLLGSVAAVLVIGMCFIASAVKGQGGGASAGFLTRQVLYVGMGVTVFVALLRISYLDILRQAPLLYLVGLLMLCGVLATRPINGARSWFDLYFFKLQPSELMKPIVILTLAHYLMYRQSYRKLTGLLVPLVLAMAPMLLILKQPDMGTAMVFVPVIFVMLFAAGARLPHLALMVLTGGAGMVAMWSTVLKDYQKRRVLAWLDPEQYRLGEAWQLLRSETAIGSGGVMGKGWGESSQGGLNLLPEKHTDFIFAVVAEEGGFLLAGLLLLLVLCAVLSGLGIAARTREPAGRLIAVGCATVIGAQSLINAGVALGLLPTTGLTFPFVSYGGSSVISAFICLGLLTNIASRQEPVLAREDFA
jgi:rod shape determining protein RodA